MNEVVLVDGRRSGQMANKKFPPSEGVQSILFAANGFVAVHAQTLSHRDMTRTTMLSCVRPFSHETPDQCGEKRTPFSHPFC